MYLFENLMKFWCYPKRNTLICVNVCAFDIELFSHITKDYATLFFFWRKLMASSWKKNNSMLTKPHKKKKTFYLLKIYSMRRLLYLAWKKLKFGMIFYVEIFVTLSYSIHFECVLIAAS